jgi:hypothetical protein
VYLFYSRIGEVALALATASGIETGRLKHTTVWDQADRRATPPFPRNDRAQAVQHGCASDRDDKDPLYARFASLQRAAESLAADLPKSACDGLRHPALENDPF